MLVEQRYKKILDLMKEDGSVKVSDLKKKLEVSSETIRRDLENMEAQGVLRRARGGAFLNSNNDLKQESSHLVYYMPFEQRELENMESKKEIAEFAITMIKEGQSIALDSGTTSFALARALKNRFQSLTVVTNSLAIVNELVETKGITLIATGGVYRSEEDAFVSDMAGMIFSKLNIDVFFLTTCGISVDRGITYQRMDEIIVQEKMLDASSKTIVIADSSKLGINSLVKMCDIDRISMIITDSLATSEQMEIFTEVGISIVKPTR